MSAAFSRRFTMIDAMVLIAATAVALLPASVNGPLAFPIFRNAVRDLSALGFNGIFAKHPRTGRMESIGVMGQYAVMPLIGVQWVFRYPEPGFLQNWTETRTHGGRATGYAVAQEAYTLVFPFLACWSVALVLLRLRRPHPETRVLWRQPGWWASVAATFAILAGAAEETYIGYSVHTVVVPTAVLVVWLTVWATLKWSAEKSWVDRTGRCLGLCWIAMIPPYGVGFVLV